MTRLYCVAAVLLVGVAAARGQVSNPDSAVDTKRQQLDAAYLQAERDLTVRLLDRCLAQAKANATLLEDLQKKTGALTKRVTELRTNDEGKRLAKVIDAGTAGQIERLITDPPIRPESLGALGEQIQAATKSLTQMRANPPAGFIPSDAQQDELIKLQAILTTSSARVNERGKWLDGLIAAAPKDLDISHAPTLDAVLAELHRRQQQEWMAAQQLGIEQARPEAREQITAAAMSAELERALEHARMLLQDSRAENEQLRLESDMRIARLRDEGQQREAELKHSLAEAQAARAIKNAQTDTALQQAQQDAQAIRLRQECKNPAVLAALAPFVTPGYWQAGGSFPSAQKQPMSLSSIRASGALNSGPDSLKKLFTLGFDHHDTLRPRWGFRTYNGNFTRTVGNPESYEQLLRVQEYLIKYGDALVHEHYLSE